MCPMCLKFVFIKFQVSPWNVSVLKVGILVFSTALNEEIYKNNKI